MWRRWQRWWYWGANSDVWHLTLTSDSANFSTTSLKLCYLTILRDRTKGVKMLQITSGSLVLGNSSLVFVLGNSLKDYLISRWHWNISQASLRNKWLVSSGTFVFCEFCFFPSPLPTHFHFMMLCTTLSVRLDACWKITKKAFVSVDKHLWANTLLIVDQGCHSIIIETHLRGAGLMVKKVGVLTVLDLNVGSTTGSNWPWIHC